MRHFPSVYAAAKHLGMSRDTIDAYESGITRKGKPMRNIPRYIAMMCAYLDNVTGKKL